MIDYNTRVVLAGVCILGASAGMVGTFAVLRRKALTGDALSHAALPGICLAFLATGEKRLPVLLLGAFLSGLLGIMVMSALRRWTRIKEDAAVGIVLSVFFGAGLALSRFIQSRPGGSKAGLNSFIFGKTAGMIAQDVQLIAACALGCLLLVLLLYKEMKLVAFDPGFAQVQGWPAALLDLLLMALLAVTVVIGLPAVGAVMMAALVILPGATARLWTQRLSTMLALAAGFGALTGLIGTLLSAGYEQMPAGPIIILAGTAFFLASLALSPRHGLLARAVEQRRFRRELQRRHLLRILFDLSEPSLPGPAEVSLTDIVARRSWSGRHVQRLLEEARRQGLVEQTSPGHFALTGPGLARAAEVARGQRLWELYLTEHPDLAGGIANLAEESIDNLLTPEQVARLEGELRRQGRLPLLAFSRETLASAELPAKPQAAQ